MSETFEMIAAHLYKIFSEEEKEEEFVKKAKEFTPFNDAQLVVIWNFGVKALVGGFESGKDEDA